MSKEEILTKHGINFIGVEEWLSGEKEIHAAMEEWAKEEMIALLNNIRHQPIKCYSKKERGKDPEYFLGHSYVEDLISRIKK